MAKSRVMPAKGFYVTGPAYAQWPEILYSSGEKAGQKYCRPNTNGFTTVVWTCVPTAREIAADYIFYPDYNSMIASLTDPALKASALLGDPSK